jgi:hypothetical protein
VRGKLLIDACYQELGIDNAILTRVGVAEVERRGLSHDFTP